MSFCCIFHFFPFCYNWIATFFWYPPHFVFYIWILMVWDKPERDKLDRYYFRKKNSIECHMVTICHCRFISMGALIWFNYGGACGTLVTWIPILDCRGGGGSFGLGFLPFRLWIDVTLWCRFYQQNRKHSQPYKKLMICDKGGWFRKFFGLQYREHTHSGKCR